MFIYSTATATVHPMGRLIKFTISVLLPTLLAPVALAVAPVQTRTTGYWQSQGAAALE